MISKTEIESNLEFSIDIVGEFNPNEFSKDWLISKKILTESEIEDFTVDVRNQFPIDVKTHYFSIAINYRRIKIILNNIKFSEIVTESLRAIFSYFSQNKVLFLTYTSNAHLFVESNLVNKIFDRFNNDNSLKKDLSVKKTNLVEFETNLDNLKDERYIIKTERCYTNQNHIDLCGISYFDLRKLYNSDVRSEVLPVHLKENDIEINYNNSIDLFQKIINL